MESQNPKTPESSSPLAAALADEAAKTPAPEEQKKTDGSKTNFDTVYAKEVKLLREILHRFVELMGRLPIQKSGINYFFGGIEDLDKRTLYLETHYGAEMTQKLFKQVSLDLATQPYYESWKSQLEGQMVTMQSTSAKEVIGNMLHSELGIYLINSILPWFRKLDKKKTKLIADEKAGVLPKEDGFIDKSHLGIEIGKWTDKDVVEACRPDPNPRIDDPTQVEDNEEGSGESSKKSAKSVIESPRKGPEKKSPEGIDNQNRMEKDSDLDGVKFHTCGSNLFEKLGIKENPEGPADLSPPVKTTPASKTPSKPDYWQGYMSVPGNESFDEALYAYADVGTYERRKASVFKRTQNSLDNLRYDLYKLVSEVRLKLNNVKYIRYSDARELFCTVDEDLKRLSDERHSQLLDLPPTLRCLDKWLQHPCHWVSELGQHIDDIYANTSGAVGNPIRRDIPISGRNDEDDDEVVLDNDPKLASLCPYCPHETVILNDAKIRNEHLRVWHPVEARRENAEAKRLQDKKLRSRSPSADKSVAFVNKDWAEDEEYEEERKRSLPPQLGFKFGPTVVHQDDDRDSLIGVVNPTLRATTRRKAELPSRGQNINVSSSGRTQTLTLKPEPPAAVLRIRGKPKVEYDLKDYKPSGVFKSQSRASSPGRTPYQPGSQRAGGAGTTRRGAATAGGTPPDPGPPDGGGGGGGGNDPNDRGAGRRPDDRRQPPRDRDDHRQHGVGGGGAGRPPGDGGRRPPGAGGGGGGPNDPGGPGGNGGDGNDYQPSEAGSNHTHVDNILERQRWMFEEHLRLQREAQQEDRVRARDVTVFNAQQQYDSLKHCSIFHAEMVKAEQVSAAYRKFVTEWEEVDSTMSVLCFTPLLKYRALRKHLKGKALELTYTQFPNNSHYEWALTQLELTFYNHAHSCSSLFAKVLSLEDMKNTAMGVQEFKIQYDSIWEQLLVHAPTMKELYTFIYSELLYAKCNPTCRHKIDKYRHRLMSDVAPFGHTMSRDDISAALNEARHHLAQAQHHNTIRNVIVTTGESKNPKKGQKDQKKASASTQEAVTQNTGANSSGAGNNGGSRKGDNDKKVDTMAPGMPSHPVHKHLCPVCEGTVGSKHQYVLQCPKLKTMTSKEVRALYHKMGSKCLVCFSTAHSADNGCPLTRATCKVVINSGPQKGETCGKRHHNLLHTDPKFKKNKNSNQTQAGGGSGAGENEQGTS